MTIALLLCIREVIALSAASPNFGCYERVRHGADSARSSGKAGRRSVTKLHCFAYQSRFGESYRRQDANTYILYATGNLGQGFSPIRKRSAILAPWNKVPWRSIALKDPPWFGLRAITLPWPALFGWGSLGSDSADVFPIGRFSAHPRC
jgi:hypothetical protein